jgi:hypothetical protein
MTPAIKYAANPAIKKAAAEIVIDKTLMRFP